MIGNQKSNRNGDEQKASNETCETGFVLRVSSFGGSNYQSGSTSFLGVYVLVVLIQKLNETL